MRKLQNGQIISMVVTLLN